MDKEIVAKYAPIALVIFAIFFQYNLFVTPQELEKTHRMVLQEVSDKYMTKEAYVDLKSQLNNVQAKVDKIYDVIIGGKE